ncbi:MAG: hypothetical protein Q9203_003644 [Teloschistes exilis]
MLLHTKGQDRNPRVTFYTKIPPGKKSLVMKWKSRVLYLPVFREPLRSAGESGTSPSQPLLASTWIRYLKQLGRKAGFEHSFTQYGLKRGLVNVVNNNAPAPTRDQIFDHRQGAAGYYFDQEIRFDTESCYLRRPSNEVVQRMARLASLTADMTAPTQLNDQQKADLKQHPKDAAPSKLYEEKKKTEQQLSCVRVKLRNKMIMQARKRHFRNADTQTFDSQFSPSAAATSPDKDDVLLPF